MHAYLTDPKVTCHPFEIEVQALFDYAASDSPEPIPQFSWQLKTEDFDRLRALAQSRRQRFEEFIHAEAMRLVPFVLRKTGEARQACAEAIATLAPDLARDAGLVQPEDFGLTRDQLIERFETMSADQQIELLNEKWDLVRGPEMIPTLERLAATAAPQPVPVTAHAFALWIGPPGVPGAAMRRLYETAPLEATAILRQDLASGKPAFAGFASFHLPLMDVPEADGAFLAMLQAESFGALGLIARFGTVRLLGPMRKLYAAREWQCAEESSFLLYFSRFGSAIDPENSCFNYMLTELGSHHWNTAIENAAIAKLNDANLDTAGRAAMVLAGNGSPAVEGPLWKRLERWASQWRGRTDELAEHAITGETAHPGEARFADTLFRALASAKSWRMDETRGQRLAAQCIDDACRKHWKRVKTDKPIAIDVSNGGSSYPPAFRVEGFTGRSMKDLETKLTQYPKGAAFRWCPQANNSFDMFSPGQREEMFHSLAAFAAAHSMTLEPYSERACAGGIVAQ